MEIAGFHKLLCRYRNASKFDYSTDDDWLSTWHYFICHGTIIVPIMSMRTCQIFIFVVTFNNDEKTRTRSRSNFSIIFGLFSDECSFYAANIFSEFMTVTQRWHQRQTFMRFLSIKHNFQFNLNLNFQLYQKWCWMFVLMNFGCCCSLLSYILITIS